MIGKIEEFGTTIANQHEQVGIYACFFGKMQQGNFRGEQRFF
jgi:hypothetical protein